MIHQRPQRIAICPHTKEQILQTKVGNEWLCLHRETRREEIQEINQHLRHIRLTQEITEDNPLYLKFPPALPTKKIN